MNRYPSAQHPFMFKENMHKFPQDVIERLVCFLDHQWVACSHDEAEIDWHLCELIAFSSAQSQREQTHMLCLVQCGQDRSIVPILREAQRDILGPCQHL